MRTVTLLPRRQTADNSLPHPQKGEGDTSEVRGMAGRPSKYDPKYCEEIIKFFKKKPQKTQKRKVYHQNGTLKCEETVVVAQTLPTFQGFARKIGVSRDTLLEWCEKHGEFSDAYARAREMQEEILVVNAMGGLYNAQFAQFFAKNCLGYREKQEVAGDMGIEIVMGKADKYAD